MSSPEFNPYESPRDPNRPPNQFADDRGELADLRRRDQDLERRLGRNWLVSPNWLLRILGIWGFLFLGYLILFAVIFSVMFVFYLATGRWP
jgi:hypothetical protein